MAVVLIEGFDHLTAAEMTSKGWGNNPGSMIAGRFAGQAAGLTFNLAPSTGKTLPSTYSTLICGVAINFTQVPVAATDFFSFQVGATLTARLGLTAAGLLTVRNSGGTTIATGTTPLFVNTWYQVEFKIVIAGASGTCEVRLDGVGEIASTVGNFGSSNLDSIFLRRMVNASGQANYFDDIYVVDTSGLAPRNTFLGDVRVQTIYPTSDGTHQQWTPLTPGTHYTEVNEPQADGDTSYVFDSNPGDIDTYGFGDIDTAATVFGLQTCLYARKDDASTRQIAPVIRQSGTDYVGSTVTLASSYITETQLYNQDPTSSDWTPTTVNANEYGVKEIA